MATWDDVRRLALALPETTERAGRDWRVRDKLFVWDRPLRRGDLDVLGDHAPDGPILGARVVDLGVKEALLQSEPEVFLTTPHFERVCGRAGAPRPHRRAGAERSRHRRMARPRPEAAGQGVQGALSPDCSLFGHDRTANTV